MARLPFHRAQFVEAKTHKTVETDCVFETRFAHPLAQGERRVGRRLHTNQLARPAAVSCSGSMIWIIVAGSPVVASDTGDPSSRETDRRCVCARRECVLSDDAHLETIR